MLSRRSLFAGSTALVGTVLLGKPALAASGTTELRARADLAVPVTTRAGWAADERLRFDSSGKEIWPAEFSRTQILTVHHTGDVSGNDAPNIIRAIYRSQASGQGWGDIGYNLFIDWSGVIYEGRYSGSDSTPVFDRLASPQMSGAAHITKYNAGNLGICLLGNLSKAQPTAAARSSLVRLLAVLAVISDLDPLGTTTYVNPVNGLRKTVRTISGHRDWTATDCPGTHLAGQFDAIRAEVAALA